MTKILDIVLYPKLKIHSASLNPGIEASSFWWDHLNRFFPSPLPPQNADRFSLQYVHFLI